MEAIGLKDVHKDKVTVDAWEFEKAEMRFTDSGGGGHCFQLGAYQTTFDTRREPGSLRLSTWARARRTVMTAWM